MAENNVNSVKEFKEFCEQLENTIVVYSTDLNENKIFDNYEIKNIVMIIEEMVDYKNKIIATKEEQSEIDELFNNVKRHFIDLKNKHVSKYNEKVQYIEAKIDKFNQISSDKLTDEIKELISKIGNNEECIVFNDGDWKRSDYLDKLNFDGLDEQIKIIEKVEKKLNIKHLESVEVWSRSNHINNTINELRTSSKEEMTLLEINKLLKKCYLCYEEILDIDLQQQLYMENEHEKKSASAINLKITGYEKSINKIIKNLLEKKKNIIKKENPYNELKAELEEIEIKYQIMDKKISEYRGKLGENAVRRFNTSYLKVNFGKLTKFIQSVEKEQDNLEKIQLKNLKKRTDDLEKIHRGIDFELNKTPFMLKGVNVGLDFSNKMKEFDLELKKLEDKITDLGEDKLKIVKDHDKRKEIDSIISDRWEDLRQYDKLLNKYEKRAPEVYPTLKSMLDERKKKFNDICKVYRGKCPLGVKQIKDTKHFYKKNKKKLLITVGLAALAITAHQVLIPAIMHGNIMMAATTPALRPILKPITDTLGRFIGASKDINGVWRMASGRILNPSCAGISLLKGLAVYSLPSSVALVASTALLISPVIKGIKKLLNKMNVAELKQNVGERIEKGKKEISNLTHAAVERINKNKEKNYDDLAEEYVNSNIDFDEFCEQKKLNKKDIIKLKEASFNLMNKNKRSRG